MSDAQSGLDGSETGIKEFFERILVERDKLDQERDRRMEERFNAQAKANELLAMELSRRLVDLNGMQQTAHAKERDFVQLPVFQTHVERNTDDHSNLVRETQQTASLLADKVQASAAVLATALTEQTKVSDARLQRLESFQAKLLGLALAMPVITALVVYLLTTNRV